LSLQPADVLAGGKPNFDEIGPFWYRVNTTRVNITFPERDGQQFVRFYRRKQYFFDPVWSRGLNDTTALITNINPGFMGAIASLFRDSVLQLVMSTPSAERERERGRGE
jgi:hypothetical protein